MAKRIPNITGADHIERIFAGISREAAEKIADALNRGGDEIADLARQLVPVRKDAGGGKLKATIDVDNRGTQVRRADKAIFVNVVAGTTKARAKAALRQEFGRKKGGSGPNAEHPGHRPQTFFFTAYWKLRRRVRGRVSRAIGMAVKEVVRGRSL